MTIDFIEKTPFIPTTPTRRINRATIREAAAVAVRIWWNVKHRITPPR